MMKPFSRWICDTVIPKSDQYGALKQIKWSIVRLVAGIITII